MSMNSGRCDIIAAHRSRHAPETFSAADAGGPRPLVDASRTAIAPDAGAPATATATEACDYSYSNCLPMV
ncbi:hypothetical protein WS72_20010 [Burkholderia savannae]|uniref:Uncharacterized protein n=1 Tax=Burkholderia savannae TaxID=1637837 RepID=A0ABR5T233_9BURK|nr:hypothetical protein WS72_20010 [Burkholderia savannae]